MSQLTFRDSKEFLWFVSNVGTLSPHTKLQVLKLQHTACDPSVTKHRFKRIKDSPQKYMIKSYCIFSNCGFAMELSNSYIVNKFVFKREESGKTEK